MTARFLDTNIFIRHVVGDDPVQSPASRALFLDIEEGRLAAWTTNVVVAEAVHVLSSKQTYNLGRPAIRNALLPLLELPGLDLHDKALYRRIFSLYTSLPIDFADAYHAALIERRSPAELYSFDTDFDRVGTIQRLEP